MTSFTSRYGNPAIDCGGAHLWAHERHGCVVLAVSGRVAWDRRDGSVKAALRLSGTVRGHVRIAWSTVTPRAFAAIKGTLGGRAVRLRTPAP